MPGHEQKRQNLLNARVVGAPVPEPLANPADVAAAYAQQAFINKLGEMLQSGLNPESYFTFLQATTPVMLRESAIKLSVIHNPTSQIVTCTLSLDFNSEPFFNQAIAAGGIASLGNIGFTVPRMAGFVTPTTPGGYVVLGGQLVS